MSLASWKTARYTAPTAIGTMICFFATLLPPRAGRAQATSDPLAPISIGTGGPSSLGGPLPAANSPTALATVDLSTGAAQTRYDFQLPPARGEAQPSLSLRYTSQAGVGFAGVGWTLTLPSIVRKGTAGIPFFDNNLDDFLIDGQLLVPIVHLGQTPPNLPTGETMPSFIATAPAGPDGWTYFRREVDDGARYFFNGSTWVEQTKSGHLLQFGTPLDNTFAAAVEVADPTTASALTGVAKTVIYRWNLVRDTDATGNNSVYYVWDDQHELFPAAPEITGTLFLTDIYDTMSAGQTANPQPSGFAHHVRLTWAAQSGANNWTPIWNSVPFAQLSRVTVASATWGATQRQLVRDYELSYTYNTTGTRPYLTSIAMVGDCVSKLTPAQIKAGITGIPEDPTGFISSTAVQNCPGLPATTYAYTGVSGAANAAPPSPIEKPNFFTFHPLAADLPPNLGATAASAVKALADLDGDGAADLVTELFPNTDFQVQSSFTPVNCPQDNSGKVIACETVQFAGGAPFAEAQSPPFATNTFSPWPFNIFGSWAPTDRLSILTLNPNALPTQLALTQVGGAEGVSFPGQPLSSADTTHLLQAPQTFLLGRAFDADGDGLPDMGLVPTTGGYQTYFSSRDRGALTHPFVLPSPAFCTSPQYASVATNAAFERAIADVDGDGISDLVLFTKEPCSVSTGNLTCVNLFVLPGRGDGRFGIPTGNTGHCYDAYGNSIIPHTSTCTGGVCPNQSDPVGVDAIGDSVIRFGDLNGDGMTDYAVLDSAGLSICLRNGPGFDSTSYRCVSDKNLSSSLFAPGRADTLADIEIADVDGSGIQQVLYFPSIDVNPTSATAVSVSANASGPRNPGQASLQTPRDGLLATVDNGYGARTIFHYTTTRNLGMKMPVPVWVVTDTLTSVDAAPPIQGVPAPSFATQYAYADPIFDQRDREFVGFKTVVASQPGDTFTQGRATTTTFATDTCLTTSSCGSGSLNYGLYRALRRLPAIVSVEDDSENTLTTEWHEYAFQNPYGTGLDGRVVFSLSKTTTHAFLWGTGQATSAQSEMIVDNVTPAITIPVTLPTGGTEVRRSRSFDILGNETSSVDFGVVGHDTPILQTQQWALPAGDGGAFSSGWSYRVKQVKTGNADATGSTFTDPATAIREFDYDYYPQGQVNFTYGLLPSTPPLPRVANIGAPPPADASQSSAQPFPLRQKTYDQFGNVTAVYRGLTSNQSKRCTLIATETAFAQFPQVVTDYPNGCGAPTAITTNLSFERGLGRIASKMSPAGRLSSWGYDDFGRLANANEPDPSLLGFSVTSVFVDYLDKAPVRRVHFKTIDGDESNPGFVDHYRFLDGVGDVLLAADRATQDAQVSGGPQWMFSSLHTRNAHGQVAFALKPFFSSVDPTTLGPSSFVISNSNLVPSYRWTYDALGRPLTKRDLDMNVTQFTYNTAGLSVDIKDAEQALGGHQGAHTMVTRDGHSRVVQTDQFLNNSSQGSGDILTKTVYQATGEPKSITQSFSGAGNAPSVTRTMTYDALGRMVQNQEPNAGTWTYAYNDFGELVGTSDARGCGENIYHDGLGRILAEDYSPCVAPPAQAAYSAPDLRSGIGTEALSVYEPDGLVVKSYDRARLTTYSYDARGRLRTIQRQIAPPPDPPAGSSDTLSISGTLVDAKTNPMSGITVTLAGSAGQKTATTDLNGRYVFSGLVSGGSYSINPSNIASCTWTPTTVANLNDMTTSETSSFMGIGSGCGGNPVSTPIAAGGNVTISGVIATSSGVGVPGIEVDLNGGYQAVTHTNASGFYRFTGLPNGRTYSLNFNSLPSGVTLSPSAINNITGTSTENLTCAGPCPVGILAIGAGLDGNYAPHVFRKDVLTYSAANRVTVETTGADVTQLLGTSGSQINVSYLPQGDIQSVGSSYGTLLANQAVDATGAIIKQTFGDAAQTTATMSYDSNEWLNGFALERAAPQNGSFWATSGYAKDPPTQGDPNNTFQTVLTNLTIDYDGVGNPRHLTENSNNSSLPPLPQTDPTQWPNGAKPASLRQLTYGDDYRLQEVQTEYMGATGSNDSYFSPYVSSDGSTYPVQAPVPQKERPIDQRYFYDFRGNMTASTDDEPVFFDRSLGTITNGSRLQTTGPDQLTSAVQGSAALATTYDAAGNLLSINVSNGAASTFYQYTWDELGRLATASRTDEGQSQISVTNRFVYGSDDARVISNRQLATGVDNTVQVFDSLALKGAAFPGGDGVDYDRNAKTEQVYLSTGALLFGHAFFDEGTMPQAAGANGALHVFMPLGDTVGSTSFVIDHDTGELVERVTYQPFGAVESGAARSRADASTEATRDGRRPRHRSRPWPCRGSGRRIRGPHSGGCV